MARRAFIALVLAGIALAGCGDGESSEAEPTSPPTEAATAPPETEEAEAPEPTEEPEPSDETYRVRSGDTLSAIAEEHGTTVRALARLNDIEDPNEIRAGQELQLPADG